MRVFLYRRGMTHAPHLYIGPTRIGDATLASSILRHIHETMPDARVTIVSSRLSAPLYEAYPNLEQIITVDKKTYSRHWLDIWNATRRTRWDTLWDMRGSAMPYLLRARRRRLFKGSNEPVPKIVQYEQQMKTGPLPYPMFWTHESHRALAQALLPDGDKFVILAPIANWPTKEWPLQHFTAAAKQLIAGRGIRPVIICAGHERQKVLPLLEAVSHHRPVDLTQGELPLLSVYACMQRAHGFIGNDSGLMHMAAASGMLTLGLFGPTEPTIYRPCGPRGEFLRAPEGDLAKLTPDVVVQKLTSLM